MSNPTSSYDPPPEGLRETFALIYRALDDLAHAAQTAGGIVRYTPPEANPIERLRVMLELPESKWKKVDRG